MSLFPKLVSSLWNSGCWSGKRLSVHWLIVFSVYRKLGALMLDFACPGSPTFLKQWTVDNHRLSAWPTFSCSIMKVQQCTAMLMRCFTSHCNLMSVWCVKYWLFAIYILDLVSGRRCQSAKCRLVMGHKLHIDDNGVSEWVKHIEHLVLANSPYPCHMTSMSQEQSEGFAGASKTQLLKVHLKSVRFPHQRWDYADRVVRRHDSLRWGNLADQQVTILMEFHDQLCCDYLEERVFSTTLWKSKIMKSLH